MTPALSQVIYDIVQHVLGELNTSIPARVLSYNPDEQRADVQPLIKRRYKDGTVLSRAPITDVPVVFPSAGGGIITFPVKTGDTVLLVFSQRSIDRWVRSDGGEVDPLDNRKHDISDAIAIPGLSTFSEALSSHSENVIIKFGAASIELTPEGAVRVTAPGGFEVVGDQTNSGTIDADGDVTGAGISLATHTHNQANDSGGDTEQPTMGPN